LILIRIHKGGWVFNGNVAEFSIDKYKNDDLSISEIARKLGKNWRTVKSMLMKKCILRILVPVCTKTGMMYDSEFGEIVDLWLEEDSKASP
jgi:hypothetical protein